MTAHSAVISYRHSLTIPETVVRVRTSASLYRSIVEGSELFKVEYGKYPNLVRISERSFKALPLTSNIIRAMLAERGTAVEVSPKIAARHLQFLWMERAPLAAPSQSEAIR